ncbi:MAG: NAD(P)-dependent glycerol-3-phosphate dehydrogenase [Oligoflexales bacterium]|nr:NAD(P)-dependent glycerol-3-phosphate dehydrogenase [Oligoflexales bacterium]
MTSPSNCKNILVLGAGNFGTCLAQHLALRGHRIKLWDINPVVVDGINSKQQNPNYLSHIKLSPNIEAVQNISAHDLQNIHSCVLAVPTQFLRPTLENQLRGKLQQPLLICCAAKGIEVKTFKLPLEIIADVLGKNFADYSTVLSGPSFATEVAENIPTAVAVAGYRTDAARETQELFHTPLFRVYTSEDPIGLEIAGALKNVIAIASGACMGLGFQNNSRAAIITRGLAEITRIGVKMGADPLTFLGLGGVGDLFLTCTSEKSRNFSVGFSLGQGQSLKASLDKAGSVAEGVTTAQAAYKLTKSIDVSSPIIDEVYHVLFESKPIQQAVRDLIEREAKSELTWE